MADMRSSACREAESIIEHHPYGQALNPALVCPAISRSSWHHLRQAWKRASIVLGSFIGRVVLAVLYFTIVPPFAVLVWITSDPLALRTWRRQSTPQWHSVESKAIGWEAARKQG